MIYLWNKLNVLFFINTLINAGCHIDTFFQQGNYNIKVAKKYYKMYELT
jgi:hypothetical protein